MATIHHILIAEDEADLCALVTHAVADLGYAVHCARSGSAAVSHLESRAPVDAVITDFAMPGGVSGTDVAWAAHRHHPAARLIVVSGHPRHVVGDLPEGTIFIQKPYRIPDLITVLRANTEDHDAGPSSGPNAPGRRFQ